ncbi:MAG: M20/M25/M40 family metallo-hydrolase, partial [Aeromicrobium sp.]
WDDAVCLVFDGGTLDAGVLADVVPTAMLFARNPTGVSHSPEERIDDADAEAGAAALADVLQDLLSTHDSSVPSTKE